jgi:tRNA pseudouridine55 synthase
MPTGFLCLDKPPGVTSRDVVNVVQKLVRPLKVGHAGTLDPLATGVLVVAVGSATRLIQYVQESPKHYRGRFRLGVTSDTDDITGNVVEGGDASGVTRERLSDVLAEFVGRIAQSPPQFSAVHAQGQRAYQLARKGETVELSPRMVEVSAIELIEFTRPEFTIDVTCGSGTYLRALGRDVGQRLGCGAVMTELRRTAIGPFTVERAVTADRLTRETWTDALWPPQTAVQQLASVALSADEATAIRCGRAVANAATGTLLVGVEVALFDAAGALLGVGVVDAANGRVQPRVVLPM